MVSSTAMPRQTLMTSTVPMSKGLSRSQSKPPPTTRGSVLGIIASSASLMVRKKMIRIKLIKRRGDVTDVKKDSTT